MKSRPFLLVLVAGGVFTPSLLAQTSTEIDIPFKKFVLHNGLTLIVHEDHKAPIVAVNVWYHVGSKNAYASIVRALSVRDLEDAARTVIHPEN